MSHPDLSLPKHVPEMKEYQSQPMDGKPFALYAIVREAASNLTVICEKCDEKCDDEIIKQMRPAPVTPSDRFVDKPLRQVIDFHRELIRGDEWDKLYFAVVTNDKWAENGICLVTLGFDEDCRPDAFFVPAEDVGITFINLQIGNTDWEEARYGYEEFNSNRQSLNDRIHDNVIVNADDDHEENEDNNKIQDGIHPNLNYDVKSSERAAVEQRQKPCFLVYNGTRPQQSAHLALDVLDSAWQKKYYKSGEHFVEGRNPWERGYQTINGEIKFVRCPDSWTETIAQHPICCHQKTRVNWRGKTIDRNIDKHLFVFYDESLQKDETVWLVRMKWDDTVSKDDQQIWDVIYEQECQVEKQACKAKDAYNKLSSLSAGSEEWRGEVVRYSQEQVERPGDFARCA